MWFCVAIAFAQEAETGVEWTVPSAVVSAIRAVADRSVGERLDVATRPFLGRPYIVDPVGEGEGADADVPARYDVFDCMSFVEEGLGMVLAGDPVNAPAIRDALRYDRFADNAHRNHFMEAQWIPRAVASGLLEDVTDRLGHARTLTKSVTPAVWQGWRSRRRFFLADPELPVGTWSLRYLDLGQAAEAAPKIPPGALVVTLRVERAWSPIVTTHVSLVVPGRSEPMMRHATKMGKRLVRDDKLSWYMTHLRDYVNWPALGVVVLMPREQGPTRAATLSALLPALPYADADGDLPAFVPQPLNPHNVGEDPS